MHGKRGSLQLCIGNLPAETTRRELRAFLETVVGALSQHARRASSHIGECTILELTDPATGLVTHQGLVSIQPAKTALEVMDLLKERSFRGARLQVRRYRHSSFDVTPRPSAETVTISDLLGIRRLDAATVAAPLRLDLVSTTGSSARPAPAPAPAPAPSVPGLRFAH